MPKAMRNAITVIVCAAALAACAHAAEIKPAPGVVFQLGTPDGMSAEFGGTQHLWPKYAETFPRPIDFTVGRDPLSAWPYIHPSNDDTWAGGRPHTFTLRFTVTDLPAAPLHLVIGQADAMPRPPFVTVAFNGQAAPTQRAPGGTGAGAFEPAGWHRPSSMVFAAPPGSVRVGENVLTIHCEQHSWIIYDYIRLGTDARPAKVDGETDGLLADALAGPLAGAPEVVFAVRQPGRDGHWYANFSYYAEDDQRLTYGPGGRLCALDLSTGRVRTLIDDPLGGVRDPQVHYDGRRIIFSWRKGDGKNFHLWEINADGTGLRQLTDGPFDDIEPTYMPDGGIIFVSGRCNRWVNCWLTKVAVLYRMEADGTGIRMLSSNNEHDNTPWPLPDGSLLYTRWEYVDRSQVHYHHLWTVNPDGAGQMVYYGNMHGGTTMIDSKPIPGTRQVVSIFSPGHGRREHEGPPAIVDIGAGPDAPRMARVFGRGDSFRDPYPLSPRLFLVARREQMLLMDSRGAVQVVHALSDDDRKANLWLHEPRPLMPRQREPVVAPRGNPEAATGTCVLADVHVGRNMEGVRPGEITKLLVLETLPKPINFTGGMEPLSYGGTFTLERVLGTVPVEADGSANFEVPALRSVFFVALDAQDRAVKRMQSFVTLQPGETLGCVGCHEGRNRAPQAARMAAFSRPVSRIRPVDGVPQVYDFPRDVQPILDRHCVACHGPEKTAKGGPRSGGVLLTGDRGPMFSHSYFMLSARRQLADGRNLPVSNYPPRALGTGAAGVFEKATSGDHHGVRVDGRERTVLGLWVDTGAAYPGTYAALGTGMIGGYAENNIDRSDVEWPETREAREVLKSNCGRCHTGALALPDSPSDNQGMPPWAVDYGSPKLRFSRHILYNLTRPEQSALLLAPLAASAGGWGVCKRGDAPADALASASSGDYAVLLAAVRRTAARLDEIKRFDMPGFVPRAAYVREMVRYGLLPADHDPASPVDVYALEERYWQSFWYRPPAAVTRR
jgi:mono/diheme cytochrome c family protein